LSFGCTFNQGYYVEFINPSLIVNDIKTCSIFGKGLRLGKRGLYWLKAEIMMNVEIYNAEKPQIIEKALFWHKRLGHVKRLSRAWIVTFIPKLLHKQIN
jgi:hypothetical protein